MVQRWVPNSREIHKVVCSGQLEGCGATLNSRVPTRAKAISDWNKRAVK
ncbi:MAG: hypothetical protein JRD89_01600 [Deltaproteobacteria bacterium]|nr:hypothetical protein [Deltaproteobacteria bacterium]